MANEFIDLSMTPLEAMLKVRYLSDPDVQDHILTSEELSSYIARLMEDQRSDPPSPDQLPDFILPTSHAAIARQLLLSPDDRNIRRSLTSSYGELAEQQYILENFDVSVIRMLRYMPPQWHQSEFFRVFVVFSGTCPLHISDEIIHVKQGTVVIAAPGAKCATPCCDDDCVFITYMLRASTFDRVFWSQLSRDNLLSGFFRKSLEQREHAAYLHFEAGDDVDLEQLLHRIYFEYFHQQPYTPQLLNALMSEFFILLLRGYEGTARLPRTNNFYWKHEFSAILNHIQNHYLTSGIEEVAAKFHYSRRQIMRIVQKYTGMSYAQLVYKLRMDKAAHLLSRHLSIEEVAAQSGYATLSSFYRAFENYYHRTPAEFRRKH